MKYDARRHAYPNIARSFHPRLSDFFRRSSRRNGISKRRVKAQKIRLKNNALFMSLSKVVSHEKLRERTRDRLKDVSAVTTEAKIPENTRRRMTSEEIKKEFLRLPRSF